MQTLAAAKLIFPGDGEQMDSWTTGLGEYIIGVRPKGPWRPEGQMKSNTQPQKRPCWVPFFKL